MEEKIVIFISGATAVGKTETALTLAKMFDAEIFSADSRQIYKEINIGTAKPTQEELDTVPHHFINHVSIQGTYTVGDFERDCKRKLKSYFEEKDIAIVAGGTGFYFRSLLNGLDQIPSVDKSVVDKWNTIFAEEGISPLREYVKEHDPEIFKTIDKSNAHRLIRAITVHEASGKPLSFFQKQAGEAFPYRSIFINLIRPREELYQRINERVLQMVENGLMDEVKSFEDLKHLNALQTVGYSEFFDLLEGKFDSEKEAIEMIQQNTRRYSKRQLTWFRKESFWKHFLPSEIDLIPKYVEHQLSSPFEFNHHRDASNGWTDITITANRERNSSSIALRMNKKNTTVVSKDLNGNDFDKWVEHEMGLVEIV